MDEIKVEINPMEFPYPFNSNLYEAWCVDKLKKAEIPIVGTIVFQGLEKGKLEMWKDLETGNTIYKWTE